MGRESEKFAFPVPTGMRVISLTKGLALLDVEDLEDLTKGWRLYIESASASRRIFLLFESRVRELLPELREAGNEVPPHKLFSALQRAIEERCSGASKEQQLVALLQECRGWVKDEDLRRRINEAGVPPRLRTPEVGGV